MFAGGEGGVQKTISLDQSRSEIMASMRAKKFDDVCLVKGNVISTYIENLGLSSRKIAFAHFDLNGFDIEKSILKLLLKTYLLAVSFYLMILQFSISRAK